MRIDYGHGEEEAAVSVLTLVIYEQEFGRDLVQDVFGKVHVEIDELLEAAEDAPDGDAPASFDYDYTDNNWTALTRALWAALKTATPETPHFDEWARNVGPINLYALSGMLSAEIIGSLFHTGDGTPA